MAINKSAVAGVMPDITIVLDMDPGKGLERALSRIKAGKKQGSKAEDRFEKEGLEFHSRVREGYLKIASQAPERVRVVAGSGEIPSIHKEICDIIDKVIP
jgi:dTMP kinase